MHEDPDVEALWPELFEPLDEQQRRSVRQSFVRAAAGGWVANREDVENLTALESGAITPEEYDRRVDETATRHWVDEAVWRPGGSAAV
ncbi:hypothetical protein [Cellulomonas cellasea]|uniref:Uncharacterized protein n=2 Tax=Cellulomonas cellasea TaxID=43670 RepID=A0A0A0B5Z1_9CELL|nr:hypothetical protein [Cellulomonas cellasea]KGM01603.1 hypothetical protein Q760_18385 [Cellulomonas cellasea DSM 20118]GEA88392.1 hypothetical protein CCE01nite_23410 [Cellulomonas cellasea]